jgi:hypothetical protein
MAKNNSAYLEKLKDPRWQKKRLEIMQRDEFTCQICGNTEMTLNVQHRNYLPNKNPWEYPNDYLATLCEVCHQYESENIGDTIHDFNLIVRSYFYSGEIQTLINGFINMKPQHNMDVTSSAIAYYLSDENCMKGMLSKYFAYLKVEHEKKHGEKKDA